MYSRLTIHPAIPPAVCPNQSQFRCGGGECISEFSRCNLVQDCRDNSDEDNCTCADFLRSKFLNRKICDGIVDCWDHSDETNCGKRERETKMQLSKFSISVIGIVIVVYL